MFFFSVITSYFQVYFIAKAGINILNKIKAELFEKIIFQQIEFFSKHNSGELIARIESDVEQIKGIFSSHCIRFVITFFIIIGAFFTLLFQMPIFALALISYTFIICFLYVVILKKIRHIHSLARESYKRLSSFLSEYIKSISCLQNYCVEEKVYSKFNEINNDKYIIEKRLCVNSYISMSLFRVLSGPFLYSLIFFILYKKINISVMTIGSVIMIFEYCKNIFMPLQHLAEEITQLQGSFVSIKRVYLYLNLGDEVNEGKINKINSESFKIEFRNVWFAYKDEEWVLKNISFNCESGKDIALVGASGSGKTTITKLLLRFYNPQKGEILINGININKFDIGFIRTFFAPVLQNITFFPGTLKENLTLFNNRISFADFEQNLKCLGLEKLLKDSSLNLKKELNENGKNISMGEKQVLSFLRALIRNPRFLILDEATAYIDTSTEVKIQKLIETFLKNRTIMVIAHRLSTIKKCKEIIVLENGKLIETGTHSELMNKKTMYYKMVSIQNLKKNE